MVHLFYFFCWVGPSLESVTNALVHFACAQVGFDQVCLLLQETIMTVPHMTLTWTLHTVSSVLA